jgi:two-component system, response regulator YesN
MVYASFNYGGIGMSAYTILVVDDEKQERDGIEMLIHNARYQLKVIKANNGQEALSCLQKMDVDILLTDIKMPFLDGIGLIRQIQHHKFEMCMILYSAYADFEYAQNAIALGVHKYLLKPINIADFHLVMEEAIQWCDDREKKKAEQLQLSKIIEDSKFYRLEKHMQLLLGSNVRQAQVEEQIIGLEPAFSRYACTPLLVCSEAGAFIQAVETIKQQWNGPDRCVHFLLEANTFFFCLFADEGQSGLEEADSVVFCDKLLAAFQQQKEAIAFIVVGRSVTGVSELKREYDQMISYSDYYYFISSNTVVYVQQDDQFESSHDILLMSIEKISTCVKVHNFEEAYQELDRMQAQINHKQSYSPIFIKYILTEMIKKIAHDTNIHTKPSDFVNEIYSTGSLSETMDVIERIIRKIEMKVFEPLDQNRIVRTVKELIARHYKRDDMGLAFLADQAHVSAAYLSTLFKKETGQNISKYIVDYRIEQAKYLLKTTNAKVLEIGEQVGFPNPSYFISIFRNKEHVSPAQYREKEDRG